MKNFSLALLLFCLANLKAQNTVVLNGKPYMVYPHMISSYDSRGARFIENDLLVTGIDFPPIIGSVKDGNYVIYSSSTYTVRSGKGKNVKIDTLNYIYGTFTVRDNRKEGNAFIFSSYSSASIKAVIPYRNDLVDGEVSLFHAYSSNYDYHRYSYEYDEAYSQYIDGKRKGKKIQYQETRLYRLLFSGGVLNGRQRYYKISKKDTLLYASFQVRDGKKEGEGRKISWYTYKKKVFKYKETVGQYVNNKKDGEWVIDYYYDETTGREYYKEGKIIHEKWINKSGKRYWAKSYGRDSVIKYVPDYLSRKRMPYTSARFDKYDDFIVFYYRNGEPKQAYVIDHYASASYYNSYEGNYTDTVLNGRLFREHTYMDDGLKTVRYYVIDTCQYNLPDNQGSYFCEERLWTKKYDSKGRLKSFDKTFYFERYNFRDSLFPALQETLPFRDGVQETYYHKALDYSFTNLSFNRGDARGCSMYYEVRGGANDGSIIQFIKLPSSYDTICLVDTLMHKGRWLYEEDSYFERAYGGLTDINSSRDYEGDENGPVEKLNESIYWYFSLSPVVHRTILLGRKTFTGQLGLYTAYKKVGEETRAMVYEIEQLFPFLQKRLVINIHIERNLRKLFSSKKVFILPSIKQENDIESGLFSGSVEHTDYFGETSVTASFSDNRIDSDIKFNGILQKDYNSRWQKHKDKRRASMPASSIHYENGQKEGQWVVKEDGYLEESVNFRKGRKNGMQILYNHTYDDYEYVGYVYHAVNDTVNGEVWSVSKYGFPYYHGYFRMGVPDGVFTEYFWEDTAGFFEKQLQFDKGFLIGNYLHYRDSGHLKLSVAFRKEDSMFYSVFSYLKAWPIESKLNRRVSIVVDGQEIIPDLDGSELLAYLFNNALFKKGFYSYYYKSGGLFKHGLKKYTKPVGQWKFYREGEDRLYKLIDFRDSLLAMGPRDSLFTYGLVKTYYDDGRLMFTGWATDKTSVYSCESDADMPIEEDYYLEFYDTVGKQVLVNGTGFITELQANGYVLKEGKLENYKKQGVWIYYTKFGLPEAIGIYKYGKKTGRWLAGDLGGLNLSEKVCYMNDAEFKAWIGTFGGNLDLTEEFYVDGIMVSSNTVETVKR